MTPAHAVCRCGSQELLSVLLLMSAVHELLRRLDAARSGKWPTQRLSKCICPERRGIFLGDDQGTALYNHSSLHFLRNLHSLGSHL